MTAKRFRVNELVKYNYSEIGEYIDENHTDTPLRNDILVELLNELHEENQDLECKLAEKHQDLTELGLKYGDIIDIKIANEVIENQRKHIKKAEKENEQLKQRNDRQAKRLAELYDLMAKKDFESLTEIIDDFKRYDEQLQREWRNLNIQVRLDND